jgi:hypothetical protein
MVIVQAVIGVFETEVDGSWGGHKLRLYVQQFTDVTEMRF